MSGLSLSSGDLKELRAVNNALLDPLSHDSTEAWLLEVCARFQALCHAPAGFAGFSFLEGEARFVSRELSQKYLDRLTQLSLLSPGRLQGGDPAVDQVMDALRQRISAVGTSADLLGPGRLRVEELKETPIFREVACPLGIPGATMLFHSGASGEFMIHAAYPEIGSVPFGTATRDVLTALLPGFAASVGALARLGNARRAIGVLLDALDDGAVVFDPAGRRVLTRNAAIAAQARNEPDRAGLEQAISRAAMAAAWPAKPTLAQARALSSGWKSLSGIPYRLRAVRLPSGCLTKAEAILVLVQRVGPPVPEPVHLMQRFGLTRREAEVAHRLAYGRSDREIATELGLSRHTVRHHAEAIFVKAGVTSRKALALHLATSPKVS